MVIVALTGRRLGRTDKWPYSGAAALPYSYVDAVLRAGGQPVIVNDTRDPKDLLARVDALVLTGGPDVDPSRYGEAAHPSVYGVDSADDDFECALAEAALVRSVETAGRTVLFSALTVAISLAALLVFPLSFLRSFAYAGISVVALAATARFISAP